MVNWGICALIIILSFFTVKEVFKLKKKEKEISGIIDQLVIDKHKDEAILKSIGDGVYVVDKNRNLLSINKVACDYLEVENQNTLVGHHCFEVLKIQNEAGVNCKDICPALKSWSRDEAVVAPDFCLICKNNKLINIASVATPLKDSKGNIIGGVVVFRDISKQNEVERERTNFVSIATHELSTPLAAIEAGISMALEEKTGKIEPPTRSLLEKVYKSCKRLASLVRSLIIISKLGKGEMELNIKPLNLDEVITEVIDEFSIQALEKGLTLKYEKSPETSMFVLADFNLARVLIENLVSNALKFTEKGEIIVKCGEKNDLLVVTVIDTGPGIPAEQLPNLFQKFRQLDQSLTRIAQGTGIGLYIAKSIVEILGGKIWVESELGKGSRFSFSLQKVTSNNFDSKALPKENVTQEVKNIDREP